MAQHFPTTSRVYKWPDDGAHEAAHHDGAGTVYGQFHYALDALAGALVAASVVVGFGRAAGYDLAPR